MARQWCITLLDSWCFEQALEKERIAYLLLSNRFVALVHLTILNMSNYYSANKQQSDFDYNDQLDKQIGSFIHSPCFGFQMKKWIIPLRRMDMLWTVGPYLLIHRALTT